MFVGWLVFARWHVFRTGQAPKQWQTSVVVRVPTVSTRKETRENAPIIGAYLSSMFRVRSMPSTLKINAVK